MPNPQSLTAKPKLPKVRKVTNFRFQLLLKNLSRYRRIARYLFAHDKFIGASEAEQSLNQMHRAAEVVELAIVCRRQSRAVVNGGRES